MSRGRSGSGAEVSVIHPRLGVPDTNDLRVFDTFHLFRKPLWRNQHIIVSAITGDSKATLCPCFCDKRG